MADKTLKTLISLRNDTAANWTSINPTLLRGEIGIEIDTTKFKIGDGTTQWSDLDYANVPNSFLFDDTGKIKTELLPSGTGGTGHNAVLFEATNDTPDSKTDATVISEYFSTTPDPAAQQGDIFVVKNLIADDKYQFTGYVYTGTEWKALDGNYDAENVYLGSDLVITANIGVQTVGSTGSKTLATTGKNLKQVLDMIVAQEKNPTITQPAVTVNCPEAKAYEVGTTVTPTYTATLSAGNYQYGPATGVTATSWAVTDTNSGEKDTNADTFDEFTVEDATNYKITAVAQYGDGAIPKTNLGNDYAAGQIKAGSKTGTSGTITGFRKYFYGSLVNVASDITSATIRALTNSTSAVGSSKTFDMPISEGTKQVIIAFPTSTGKALKSVKDQNAFGTDIVASFVKSTVQVEGANAYTAVDYDVYVYAPDAALGANTYNVTIG